MRNAKRELNTDDVVERIESKMKEKRWQVVVISPEKWGIIGYRTDFPVRSGSCCPGFFVHFLRKRYQPPELCLKHAQSGRILKMLFVEYDNGKEV